MREPTGQADESRPPRMASAVVVEPDSQGELALGFHHREHDAAGNPFRWAGKADHFELRFHIDRFAPRPFRMLGQFAPGVRPDQLRAYVDYRSIPVQVEYEPGPDASASVVGLIPADPLGGGHHHDVSLPSRRLAQPVGPAPPVLALS